MFFRIVFQVILLCLLFTHSAHAQYPSRMLELGFGMNSYKGDLSSSFDKYSPTAHLGIYFHSEKRINFYLSGYIGNLNAQSTEYISPVINKSPKTFVETAIYGAQFEVLLNIYKKENFKFYLYQGLGIVSFSPKDAEGEDLTLDTNFEYRADGEEYSQMALTLPTGVGLLYVFKNGYSLGLKANLLNPQTDYLDNMSQLGDGGESNDQVFQTKLSFYIPLKLKD